MRSVFAFRGDANFQRVAEWVWRLLIDSCGPHALWVCPAMSLHADALCCSNPLLKAKQVVPRPSLLYQCQYSPQKQVLLPDWCCALKDVGAVPILEAVAETCIGKGERAEAAAGGKNPSGLLGMQASSYGGLVVC